MNATDLDVRNAAGTSTIHTAPADVRARPAAVFRWLLHDSPYIAMLVLALVGIMFRLSVPYWIVLTPVFGVISAVLGWRHFATSRERLDLVYRLGLSWAALLLAIYLLYGSGVQSALTANGNTLTMVILLALGTFVAGVQARVWRICVVGGVLFLAVPGLGWLDQSPLLVTVATLVVVAFGALAWLVTERE